MSPSILVVPVDPCPPQPALEALAARLEQVYGRAARVVDPVPAPAAARSGPGRLAAGLVGAAIAATWGCGCRDRIVGVTAAALEGEARPGACGGVLVLCLPPNAGPGPLVRAVGRSLGLDDCAVPGCAMHAGSDAATLCRACRGRC